MLFDFFRKSNLCRPSHVFLFSQRRAVMKSPNLHRLLCANANRLLGTPERFRFKTYGTSSLQSIFGNPVDFPVESSAEKSSYPVTHVEFFSRFFWGQRTAQHSESPKARLRMFRQVWMAHGESKIGTRTRTAVGTDSVPVRISSATQRRVFASE